MELKNGEQSEHAKLQKDIDDVRKQVAGLPNKEKMDGSRAQGGDATAGGQAAEQAFDKGVTNNPKVFAAGAESGSDVRSGKGRQESPSRVAASSSRRLETARLPTRWERTPSRRRANTCTFRAGRKASSISVWSIVGIACKWECFPASSTSTSGNISRAGCWARRPWRIDYLFGRGRIGVFGTKGFRDNAVINRAQLGTSSFTETYLKIVNQAGASGQFALVGNTYLEGNFGYLESHAPGQSGRPGGMLRLVHPLNAQFALTAEVGLNETYLASKNSGRVVIGLEFGKWMRPGQYLANHAAGAYGYPARPV